MLQSELLQIIANYPIRDLFLINPLTRSWSLKPEYEALYDYTNGPGTVTSFSNVNLSAGGAQTLAHAVGQQRHLVFQEASHVVFDP